MRRPTGSTRRSATPRRTPASASSASSRRKSPTTTARSACSGPSRRPGSAVHPVHPSPVTARHVIGQMLPDAAFGCLAKALPGRIPAESAGSIWVLPFGNGRAEGGGAGSGGDATRFNVMNVGMGGTGARPGKDGLAVTAFPSGVGAIPVEVTESESPLVFWRKEFLPDSGAPALSGGGSARSSRSAAPRSTPSPCRPPPSIGCGTRRAAVTAAGRAATAPRASHPGRGSPTRRSTPSRPATG